MENKLEILNAVASVMMMGTCCISLAFIIKTWRRINHVTALVEALWSVEKKRGGILGGYGFFPKEMTKEKFMEYMTRARQR